MSGCVCRPPCSDKAPPPLLPRPVGTGRPSEHHDRHDSDTTLLRVVEGLPDGFVVTDEDLQVVSASGTFLDLAQVATEHQAVNEPLERGLGGVAHVVANLREHGSVRHVPMVSAVLTAVQRTLRSPLYPSRPDACFGFTIRHAARRTETTSSAGAALPRSVEQLTELVGRVSLKELVRETTDMIERLCIEAALELTGNNRASAAEMLGLSRQSLYVKLRRYGLGDLDPDLGSAD